MTPEEQARRLVEEALPCICAWPTQHDGDCPARYRDDLVRRLVPVFARAHEVNRQFGYREEDVKREGDLRAKLERAEATVARLRKAGQALHDVFAWMPVPTNERPQRALEGWRAALAATEEKP